MKFIEKPRKDFIELLNLLGSVFEVREGILWIAAILD